VNRLYAGKVFHQRLTPRRHTLSYRIFMLGLNLADLDDVAAGLRLFSRNRFNLISLFDRDFGDGSGRPVREQVLSRLTAEGIGRQMGRIVMLTMPRVLGRAFNPLTVFFCSDLDGRPAAVVYEVTNTFGARRHYVLPVVEAAGPHRHGCAKSFFVSPFMDMDLTYAFQVTPPGETVAVAIGVSEEGRPILTASFAATGAPLSDRALMGVVFSHPLQLVGVLAGIYFEGLKLVLKGLRWRPPPPGHSKPVADRRRSVSAAQ